MSRRMSPDARKRLWLVTGLAVVVLLSGASALRWHANRLPKRFAPVVLGRLYRSGSVTPAQLERLHRELGIQRVVCLLDTNAAVTTAERDAAAGLGLDWRNIPLTGNGASLPEDRRQILALLADPNAPPTLVHCSAGTNRTGLAVGLYRLHCQHWPLSDVLAEMKQFGFDDLPKHEDLRRALTAEAELARAATAGPK
jgi:protein tyrosine/serine phosphatase